MDHKGCAEYNKTEKASGRLVAVYPRWEHLHPVTLLPNSPQVLSLQSA